MPAQVCLTRTGVLALLDAETGLRFDVTTQAAVEAAVLCDEAVAAGHPAITIATADGRECRCDGTADEFRKMADDLRGAARLAREYASIKHEAPRRVQIGGRG